MKVEAAKIRRVRAFPGVVAGIGGIIIEVK